MYKNYKTLCFTLRVYFMKTIRGFVLSTIYLFLKTLINTILELFGVKKVSDGRNELSY